MNDTKNEILYLFCGQPIDCENETIYKLEDILKSFRTATVKECLEKIKELTQMWVKGIESAELSNEYNQALSDVETSLNNLIGEKNI